MKRFLLLLVTGLLLGTTVFFVGCGENDVAKIKDAIQEFTDAYNTQNFGECVDYMVGMSEQEENAVISELETVRGRTREITIEKIEYVTISDSTATASVTTSVEGETDTYLLKFNKEDGLWRIVAEEFRLWPDDFAAAFNPVSWTTDYVSLTAKDFYIEADGVKYLANVQGGSVHSDPGESDYCTLEIIWNEHWQEMRLFIYFTADATHWWADEIRTYDGQSSGWIYYEGMFFKTALGSAFVGDVDLTSSRSEESIQGEEIQGKVHFEGLELQAFRIAERDNVESANAELVTVQAAIESCLAEASSASLTSAVTGWTGADGAVTVSPGVDHPAGGVVEYTVYAQMRTHQLRAAYDISVSGDITNGDPTITGGWGSEIQWNATLHKWQETP
jgi:hypothetical protein